MIKKPEIEKKCQKWLKYFRRPKRAENLGTNLKVKKSSKNSQKEQKISAKKNYRLVRKLPQKNLKPKKFRCSKRVENEGKNIQMVVNRKEIEKKTIDVEQCTKKWQKMQKIAKKKKKLES